MLLDLITRVPVMRRDRNPAPLLVLSSSRFSSYYLLLIRAELTPSTVRPESDYLGGCGQQPLNPLDLTGAMWCPARVNGEVIPE